MHLIRSFTYVPSEFSGCILAFMGRGGKGGLAGQNFKQSVAPLRNGQRPLQKNLECTEECWI